MAGRGGRAPKAGATAATRPPGPARRRRALVVARALPSWRALLVGWLALAAAGGAYAAARETSLFAVGRIQVSGVPPPVAAAVRSAVGDYRGASLVGLDGNALLARVEAVPAVSAARYDRAFPHTLRIFVRAEEPVAVLRAGTSSWLVAASARVLARVPRRARPALPRIWVPAASEIAVGGTLAPDVGGDAARALAPLRRAAFPVRIDAVTLVKGDLSFSLAGGIELRLGQPNDVRLKLAVARRILRMLPPQTTYVDVSVPQRPVSGGNAQVSG